MHPDAAARHHPEALLGEACHREVGHDAAALVEHRGIRHLSRRPVHLVGGDPLQVGQRAGAAHLELDEGRGIEEHDALAGRPMLRGLDR